MKKIIINLYILLIAVLGFSCESEGRLDFMDSDAPAPAPITEYTIEAKPGGAVLKYKIPNDPNFAYAKAVYEIRPGVTREAKASRYSDTLSLVGYGDTNPHNVQLFSVGKNEKESSSVSLTVTPLTPPVVSVFNSLELKETFGGAQVAFKNPSNANLAMYLMVENETTGRWRNINTFYSGATEGSFSARGFDVQPRKFAIVIRDRWLNKSDTLVKTLTPLFEQLIPKTTWSVHNLPNDMTVPAEPAYTLNKIWDNAYAIGNSFASTNASSLPQWFTLNLGEKVVISRFKVHQTSHPTHVYSGSAFKTFELYGSNNPNPDGSWESWEKLGKFSSFKPSGLPGTESTPEDRNYASFLGEDFVFDVKLPAYRYIRFKTLDTYGSAGQVVIAELTLWGQIER